MEITIYMPSQGIIVILVSSIIIVRMEVVITRIVRVRVTIMIISYLVAAMAITKLLLSPLTATLTTIRNQLPE